MDVINFLKSNSINIEEFKYSDEDIFYDWVKKSKADIYDFSNNWQYIIQATRNFHGFVENEDGIVYLTKIRDKESKCLVIVNYFGDGAKEIMQKIISIVKNTEYRIIIKNVTTNKEKELKLLGFGEFNQSESWINFEKNQFWLNNPRIHDAFVKNNFEDSEFRYDDNTYPEALFDIENLLAMKGGLYASLREKINRFKRRFGSMILIEEYNSELHEKEVRDLLDEWSQEMEENNAEEKTEAKKAHEFCFIEELGNKIRLVFKENERIIGFSYLVIRNDFLAHNGLFQHKSYNNLKKWLVVASLEYVVKNSGLEHLKIIGFQGSETKSLSSLKMDFKPFKKINKKHLIY